jgi:hypothetical protein
MATLENGYDATGVEEGTVENNRIDPRRPFSILSTGTEFNICLYLLVETSRNPAMAETKSTQPPPINGTGDPTLDDGDEDDTKVWKFPLSNWSPRTQFMPQEIQLMKQRVEEMEREASKLRELQAAAENANADSEMDGSGVPMEAEEDKTLVDGRSIYVGNVRATSSFLSVFFFELLLNTPLGRL